MLQTIITVIVGFSVIVLWVTSTQRKLVTLNDNISNAMSQIGMQLSCRIAMVLALLDVTKCYAKHDSEILIKTIETRRSSITAKSTPFDVLRQEAVISETLGRIIIVTEQYPELQENQNYIKTMDAVKTFENMLRTSRLIYNDSVSKLNHEIHTFPISMIAGILGFKQRDYLEQQVENADKLY